MQLNVCLVLTFYLVVATNLMADFIITHKRIRAKRQLTGTKQFRDFFLGSRVESRRTEGAFFVAKRSSSWDAKVEVCWPSGNPSARNSDVREDADVAERDFEITNIRMVR